MSSAKGIVRKVYDVGPSSLQATSTAWGTTGTTGWASGICDPGSVSSVNWLSAMSQGVTDNSRVGFSVAAESLDVTIVINPDVTIAGHSVLRWILVADEECDGSTPSITEVLGDSNNTATTIATGLIGSHLQPGFFGRFKVLADEYWDWHVSLGGASPTAIDYPRDGKSFVHRRHIDLKDHTIMWDMTDASAIANARKGHLFMFWLYQNVTTAAGGVLTQTTTDPPSIQFSSRMRYRDA